MLETETNTPMNLESVGMTVSPGERDQWWAPRLVWPLIAATVVRISLLAVSLVRNGSSVLFQPDTVSYLDPGRNLVLHGRFIADGVPDLVRTPGYSLFLGITSLAGLPAAGAANAIVSALTVILVWRLGRTVFGDDRIALGAAWIFAFEPISVAFSIALLSETLFLVPFLISLERLAEFLRGHRLRVLAVAGLWLAAATFVRPITYYLPIALALGLLLALARVPGLRWKAPAVLLISVLPWLAAWQVRNWVETGYRGFSSISDINLYFFDAADVKARLEHRGFSGLQRELGFVGVSGRDGQSYLYPPYLALHPEQAGWSQGQRLAFMHSEGLRIIQAHYGTYLVNSVSALVNAVFSPGAGFIDRLVIPGSPRNDPNLIDEGAARGGIQLIKKSPWKAVEKVVFEVVLLGLYLFAARGLWSAARGAFRGGLNNACLWLLLGTSAYLLLVAALSDATADSRLRVPVMPVVCILAAAGILGAKPSAR
jgi:Dolichyl-phosphate-mannose-protein mannosyltransferase